MTKVFTVDGMDFVAKFPSEFGLQKIEIDKQVLTANKYKQILETFTPQSERQIDVTDMVACFRVILPDLIKSLDDSIDKWQPKDTNKLLRFYKKEFLPWYNPLIRELLDYENEEGVAEKKS